MRLSRRGFSRADLAAIVAALFVLVCGVATTGMSKIRRDSRIAVCQANLLAHYKASFDFSQANQESIPGFRWRAKSLPRDADRASVTDDLSAVQQQAVGILRHLTGHPDLVARADWLPQVQYNWLATCEAGPSSVMPHTVCPEDRELLQLRRKYTETSSFKDAWADRLVRTNDLVDRSLRAYASTYQFVPAAWTAGQPLRDRDVRGLTPTVEQGATDDEYRVPKKNPFGERLCNFSLPGFNDRKVFVYDPMDRHSSGSPRFYADLKASQPVLMFDASSRWISTREANKGGQPNGVNGTEVTTFVYRPAAFGVGVPGTYQGFYRWTRGGLMGTDVRGEEMKSGGGWPAFGPESFSTARP